MIIGTYARALLVVRRSRLVAGQFLPYRSCRRKTRRKILGSPESAVVSRLLGESSLLHTLECVIMIWDVQNDTRWHSYVDWSRGLYASSEETKAGRRDSRRPGISKCLPFWQIWSLQFRFDVFGPKLVLELVKTNPWSSGLVNFGTEYIEVLQ